MITTTHVSILVLVICPQDQHEEEQDASDNRELQHSRHHPATAAAAQHRGNFVPVDQSGHMYFIKLSILNSEVTQTIISPISLICELLKLRKRKRGICVTSVKSVTCSWPPLEDSSSSNRGKDLEIPAVQTEQPASELFLQRSL